MKSWKAGMFKDLFSHLRTISHKVNLPESLVKLMPSDNPQMSGYLPPAAYSIPATVYDQLTAFKADRGLESIEMAVTIILSEYFGLLPSPVVSATDTTTVRLETLEAKCSSLSVTVAELQTAIATIQSSSQSKSDRSLSGDPPLMIPLQHTTEESINSPSVDRSKSLKPAAVNGSLGNQNEPEQLPTKQIPSDHQCANNLSVEYTEAPDLTAAYALSSKPKDIEPELAPGVQEQPNLEQRGEETFSTPMTRADLAKRLGVATSTVSRMQSKSNFPEWSNHRDPAGIAWVKSVDGKLFYPQSHKQD